MQQQKRMEKTKLLNADFIDCKNIKKGEQKLPSTKIS